MSLSERIFQDAVRQEDTAPAVNALVGHTITKAHIEDGVIHLTTDDGTEVEFVGWAEYADDSGVAVYLNGKELASTRSFIGPRVPIDPNSFSGRLMQYYVAPIVVELNRRSKLLAYLEGE